LSFVSNTITGVVMNAAIRPWVTTGVALVAASVIAVTPIATQPQTQFP